MRIIAGSAGGRRLTAPAGANTRPTADKVREALFNILGARTEPPARVLDLFAGSGALAFEALSRGSGRAVLVDADAKALEAIRKNAQLLGFSARAEVVRQRVDRWLKAPVPASERFGWVFVDPPYGTGDLEATLGRLGDGEHLAPGGTVIAEHDTKHEPAPAYGRLALADRRRYGQTAVSFYMEASPVGDATSGGD